MTPPPGIQIDEKRPLLVKWMAMESTPEEWEASLPIEWRNSNEN